MYRIEQPTILFDSLIPGLIDLFKFAGISTARSFSDWQEYLDCGDDLTKVQALFVRSTTTVNECLLARLPALEFVASATSGIDHLKTDALVRSGITWASAKGSNAQAVADYVVYALDGLVRQGVRIPNAGAVVIGYGCVGKRVYENLHRLGLQPQWVDPFVKGAALDLVTSKDQVESWLSSTRLLCIHTPLTQHHQFPTENWLNNDRLRALPDGAVVICAGRGGTLVGNAVKNHSHRLHFVLDVFPNEPKVDPLLVRAAAIATPHIAGHSSLGKLRGSWQVFKAYCDFASRAIPVSEQGFYHHQFLKAPASNTAAITNGILSLPKDSLRFQGFSTDGIADIHSHFDLLKIHEQFVSLSQQQGTLAASFKKMRSSYVQHPELRW